MTRQDDRPVTAADRGTVVTLTMGYMASQTIQVATRFTLADRIGDGVRTAADLAAECGTDPGATYRLLRALAALGLFRETEPGNFALTPAGALLRTDRPDSLFDFASMFTDPSMESAWRRLESAVRTGDTTFDKVYGTDFFAYLSTRPDLSARFNAAMSQGTTLTATLLPDGYDFTGFTTVADIGGGDGTLLAAILARHRGLRGVLFDTADGLTRAPATLRNAGVEDRCVLRTGDFFTAVPPDCDLYLLKSVVHDWDDDRAATILRHCRTAMPEHGRLLLIEPVFPDIVDSDQPAPMYLSDLNMMVLLGGRERTRVDFETLCHTAGFATPTVTALPSPAAFRLIEAAPA